MVASLYTKLFEEVAVFGSCIGMNFGFAVYALLQSYLMMKGLSPLFIVILGSLTASLFFLPFAVYLERKQWPQRLGLNLMWKFPLISVGSITLFQTLMIYGIKKTSPALASVTPNLAPGFIFIIASVLGYEKINIKCIYSQVKILGTVVSIAGAILMSLMHTIKSATISADGTPSDVNTTDLLDKNRIVGTSCLIAAVIVLSFVVILQASTLREFPAPISFTVVTWSIGAIFTGIVQLLQEHSMGTNSASASGGYLICWGSLGGITLGACSCIQSWAIKKKGPVFVATFCPINTVFSLVLASIALKEFINLGSLAGMILMFLGLYSVLWAKRKEDFAGEERSAYDVERPLLR